MKQVSNIEDVHVDDQLAILKEASVCTKAKKISGGMMIVGITPRGLTVWSTRLSLIEKLGLLMLAIQTLENGERSDVPNADPENTVS